MIYFDTPQIWPGPLCARLGKAAHLITDGDPSELATFARRIGLKPAWLQHGGTWREHYDMFEGRVPAALAAGAVQIDRATFVGVLRKKRGAAVTAALRDPIYETRLTEPLFPELVYGNKKGSP
jgi:hypothetical protein